MNRTRRLVAATVGTEDRVDRVEGGLGADERVRQEKYASCLRG